MQVGFIGLGHMGQHMARHVAEAGHNVAAFDLRAEAVAQLTKTPNARRASSVAEAASGAEIVFTSLPGPPEVESVVSGPDGLMESMQSGTVYVDLSSNSPTTVRKLHAAFADRGISMLDAPVAGGVIGAEAGTLSVMVGGDQATFERVRPVLAAFGARLFYCGPSGNGAITKLCNNLSSQAQIAAAGEILSLGVKAGVDLEILASAIGQSTGTCRAIVDTFPKQLFRRHFEDPGFTSILSAKDTHLAIEMAHEFGVPMPIGEIVERDKQEALRRGWGPLSPDVFVRLQEERAGVTLEYAKQTTP
ncbi:MAG: NAD(P)-dependent oxidoreductase [Chloroflexi bacterium]|nr:NAD(P)-dependent oxidoreductase [Chloroflexota bacterium]MBV9133121.1 NAD(P)-dependent oxidoreductase [Chloroflexota bacterium]MBV9893542.1 NAD(P)-dependent oxidoreductase [Chloroflexota bacterium]